MPHEQPFPQVSGFLFWQGFLGRESREAYQILSAISLAAVDLRIERARF